MAALEEGLGLKKLQLSNNMLTETGGQQLVQAIELHPVLQASIAGNQVDHISTFTLKVLSRWDMYLLNNSKHNAKTTGRP